MGNSYVDGKVRDALMAAKGSRATAQKLLMTWAVEDPQLLLGIAQPFLKAIAAAAIERGARPAGAGRSPAPGAGRGRAAPEAALSKEALANVLNRLGRDPDEDVPQPRAAKPAAPGAMKSATMVVPASGGAPSGVSHEKAMMAIAKAFVAKKIR